MNFSFIVRVKWEMEIFWKVVLVKFASKKSALTEELVFKIKHKQPLPENVKNQVQIHRGIDVVR